MGLFFSKPEPPILIDGPTVTIILAIIGIGYMLYQCISKKIISCFFSFNLNRNNIMEYLLQRVLPKSSISTNMSTNMSYLLILMCGQTSKIK